ncbi:MAG: DUF2115 family protein [Methanobacterium sp.]
MKSSELFLEIKRNIERYKSKLKYDNVIDENTDSINSIMAKYNRDNFNEIMDISLGELNHYEIPNSEIEDFKKRIDYFFSLYSGEDEDFKEFIKLISLYLAFIAKKPLHPPGIIFSKERGVYKDQDVYYCTGKNEFSKDKLSLCKYCICNQINP